MTTSTITANDIRRLSVAQYHAMIDVGILTEDDPVELLKGWLVNKRPKNPKHRLVTQLTREALAEVASDNWYVDAQEPVTTADSSLQRDRTTKKQLYAAVGIPEFWIVNLLENQLEKYADPLPDANQPDYGQC